MTEHDAVPISAFELAELRRDAARWRCFRNLDRFGIADFATGAFIDGPTEMDTVIDEVIKGG
jgi:hypothetical protein